MAHWAEIDETNTVLRVLVGNNDDADEGYQWLIDNLGGTWLKTSFNTIGGVHKLGGTPFRKNFAGIGFTYDSSLDAFIPPKPLEVYRSLALQEDPITWVLDKETCLWVEG